MILQLAAETFVRLIKIIILFTGGRTFVRESQLIQLTLGKNFCQDSPSSQGYAAGYPSTNPRASPRCSSSSSWRRCSSQMQLADAAHLLDNSRGLTAAARERMFDYEQSMNQLKGLTWSERKMAILRGFWSMKLSASCTKLSTFCKYFYANCRRAAAALQQFKVLKCPEPRFNALKR